MHCKSFQLVVSTVSVRKGMLPQSSDSKPDDSSFVFPLLQQLSTLMLSRPAMGLTQRKSPLREHSGEEKSANNQGIKGSVNITALADNPDINKLLILTGLVPFNFRLPLVCHVWVPLFSWTLADREVNSCKWTPPFILAD